MVFPTPPPSTRKENKNTFMKPVKGLTYYEDIYGKLNEDETFDRFPDECEEESSSDESVNHTPECFFARLRGPKSKEPAGTDLTKGGNLRKSERKPGTGSGIFNFLTHTSTSTSPISGRRYKIAPSLNKKHSLQASQVRDENNKRLKLKPKKGGLFASSLSTMNFQTGSENTAGEAMDDLLRAGAEGAVDFEDGFALLDEDYRAMPPAYPYPSLRIDPALLLENAVRNDSGNEDSDVEIAKFNPINAGVREGEEGDVEDNASGSTTGSRGRGRKNVKPSLISRKVEPAKPAAAVANTKSKVLKPAAAARTSTRITKSQPTTGGARILEKEGKAAQLQAKNRRLMTARAATLRGKKAKKVDVKSLRGDLGGRRGRLRNWKGQVIDGGKGFVVVCADETDGEGYEQW